MPTILDVMGDIHVLNYPNQYNCNLQTNYVTLFLTLKHSRYLFGCLNWWTLVLVNIEAQKPIHASFMLLYIVLSIKSCGSKIIKFLGIRIPYVKISHMLVEEVTSHNN
jgi:steroid 5-alpha reductase family enzyme